MTEKGQRPIQVLSSPRRRRLGIVRSAAAAMVLGMALAGCGSGTVKVTAASSVNLVTRAKNPVRIYAAPTLAEDPAQRSTVYLGAVQMLRGTCEFYRSTNRGVTWQKHPAPNLPGYTNCGPGRPGAQNMRLDLAQAPNGILYYAFAANNPALGGTRSVVLGRSSDQGSTWRTTIVDAGPTVTNPKKVQINFEPHLAFDPAHPAAVYVTWRRSYDAKPSIPERPWMAVSHNSGASFGAPFMMFNQNPGFDAPRPIVVGNRLWAFYRVPLSHPLSGNPPIKTVLYSAVSADGGHQWVAHKITSANDASEPIPVYDPTRKAFDVVWHDNRDGAPDIFFSRSSDGAHWSAPVRLNTDPLHTTRGHLYPQISLAPNGRLDVIWYDYRNDPTPAPVAKPGKTLTLGSDLGNFQDVYYTYSTNGGSTWATPNVRVTDISINRTRGIWNIHYFWVIPPSLVSGNTWMLAAWSDTRAGNATTSTQDIATRLMNVTQPGHISTLILVIVIVGAGGIVLGAGLLIASRRRA